ncbi:MAG TPA: glycosyl hydrolase [Clostridiales bacterium]|nr:glycosyl hydrolase [Clostridiales bacterium]
MKKLFNKTLWMILSVVMATLLVISTALYTIAYSYQTLLNQTFGLKNYDIVDEGDGSENTEYFKAKYTEKQELMTAGATVSEAVEAEGLVLMKNNGALPLDKSKGLKVSLFGTGSVNINNSVQGMRGGAGGAIDSAEELTTFKDALEAVDVKVNGDLWNLYLTGAAKSYGGYKKLDASTNIQTYYINEAPWSVYGTVRSTFAEYSDAAVVVLTRDGTEGADLNAFGSDGKDGNYLALSNEETDLLKEISALKRSGTFKNIIVILNSAAAIQLDFLENEDIDVDACMWIGNTGMTGINAVAKALVGDVVPSGRLSDTYVYDNFSSPAMASWVLNNNKVFSSSWNNGNLDNTQKYYGVYVEGIYVGYRYYETRYADVVEKASNVGVYNYTDTVAYPFGSGMSYTNFEYGDISVEADANGKTYEVSVEVTNAGNAYSGKEVVQIYLQKPYTDYAIENQMEVAAVELVGFGKTEVLAPGAKQTVTVTVEKEDFASYDVYGAETYILDEGTYYLAAGKDAHDALNNILAKKGFTTDDGMDYNGNAGLAWSTKVEVRDTQTYAVSGESGKEINNKLAFADPNRNINAGGNLVTYVSRSNWTGTWPKKAVTLELTAAMVADLQSDKEPENEGEMPAFGESNGLTLIMLRGKDYDDADWDKLLDEMSFEDYNTLLTTAYCITAAVESVVKPETKEMDGPTYCKEQDGAKNLRFPCEGIWASTFNVDLLAQVGEVLANHSLFLGYHGMWIPGINIHRTPYNGRTHEYFSEDPFLTGICSQAEIEAIQEYGVIAWPKHFILNDQEANRNGIGIWGNEQAIREIMLKPWKYALSPERGNAHGVMSSFNRVGSIWSSGSPELVNGIMRDEFGFNGMIITDMADANGTVYMSCVDGIMAGTDLWLSSGKDHSFAAYKNNATVVNAMRESCHRILYNVCNYSAAMNGYSSTTKLERVYVWWEKAVISLLTVSCVLAAASLTMLILSEIKNKKDGKSLNDEKDSI